MQQSASKWQCRQWLCHSALLVWHLLGCLSIINTWHSFYAGFLFIKVGCITIKVICPTVGFCLWLVRIPGCSQSIWTIPCWLLCTTHQGQDIYPYSRVKSRQHWHGILLCKCFKRFYCQEQPHCKTPWRLVKSTAWILVLCDSDLTKSYIKRALTSYSRRDIIVKKYFWFSYKVFRDFEFKVHEI